MPSKKGICFILIWILLGSSVSTLPVSSADTTDSVAFTILFNQFRYLEDCEDDAIFWIECIIGNTTFISPEWNVSQYGKSLQWSISVNGPSYPRIYNLTISLFKSVDDTEVLCDLSGNELLEDNSVELSYNIDNGWWNGDDFHGDDSGYGRVNGCDDGSIYTFEDDAELFFTIIQEDEDGDHIPSWIETNVFDTNPLIDDTLTDYDGDGIGSTWEWYFGYNPIEWDDHNTLDPDNDSISNVEEWLTRDYGSDPFRRDIFLEIDCMSESPSGESSIYPEGAVELLHYPFHRRNYVVHVNRSDIIPFDEKTDVNELLSHFQTYFLNDDSDNWRRGVFHYGLYVYEASPKGYAFSGDVKPHWGYHPGTDGFVISSTLMARNDRLFKDRSLAYFYASATMHEMGHNFGIRMGDPFGCDSQFTKYPWQIMYYVYGNYKSIMNYRYTYKIFDYSDGSHGFLDHDDWSALDLSYFEYR